MESSIGLPKAFHTYFEGLSPATLWPLVPAAIVIPAHEKRETELELGSAHSSPVGLGAPYFKRAQSACADQGRSEDDDDEMSHLVIEWMDAHLAKQ